MNPLPVTEHLLCCFAAVLADQDLTPQTAKSYGSEYANLTGPPRSQGALLSPHSEESAGRYLSSKTVAWDTTQDHTPHHNPHAFPDKNSGHFYNPRKVVLWAIACTAFFGFFGLGELLMDAKDAFNPAVNLAWGDVAVDNQENPQMI